MEKTSQQTPSNCLKIVLFGPESTGKTTLAKQLAKYFDTVWVPEYMRGYLQKKWDEKNETIQKSDLLPIVKGQKISEERLLKKANQFLFCDTNARELKVYCEYYYDGFCPSVILEECENEHYDFYFLTSIDVPWEADDLRDRPTDRQNMFRIFEEELVANKLPYEVLTGNENERFETAIAILKKLKNQ